MNPEETSTESPPPPERILEALLFVGGEPLTSQQAREVIRGLTEEHFIQLIAHLNQTYTRQGRPYRIKTRGPGYQLVLLPRFRVVVDRLFGSTREAQLSQGALDVLSLIAYRQPLTRAEVESLRGADCATTLRQLVRLGLISLHRSPDGGDTTYQTTPRFLHLFGLRSLEDLPRTQELRPL
jgi:segregation and condensation protein B